MSEHGLDLRLGAFLRVAGGAHACLDSNAATERVLLIAGVVSFERGASFHSKVTQNLTKRHII